MSPPSYRRTTYRTSLALRLASSPWSALRRHSDIIVRKLVAVSLLLSVSIADDVHYMMLLLFRRLCVAQPPKVQKSKAAKLLAAQSSSKSKGKKKVRIDQHRTARLPASPQLAALFQHCIASIVLSGLVFTD